MGAVHKLHKTVSRGGVDEALRQGIGVRGKRHYGGGGEEIIISPKWSKVNEINEQNEFILISLW